MGKAFSYSYDGTNRGEAIVNKAMYIVYNEEAEAFTDLVEKFDRWHGALQKGNWYQVIIFLAVKQAANRKGKGFVNALGHKNVV